MKDDNFKHPLKSQIELFFDLNDCAPQITQSHNEQLYSFYDDKGTTCILKLQTETKENAVFHFLDAEFSVGPIKSEVPKDLLADVCLSLHRCNYPFRSLMAPHPNGDLLIIQFRGTTDSLKVSYVDELLNAGFELAHLLRQEFKIDSVVKSRAS